MGFVVVFAQELLQGKGVVDGVREGDPINLAFLAAGVFSILGLTVFLALQGDDDFVDEV
jgi:hypothetical protein